MAVTTRISRPEPRDNKTGRDPHGTARLIHKCRGCESVHQIEITPDTAIISVGARTCEECLPAGPPQARSDAGGAPVKAWWTITGDAAPHWEIARTTQDADFQYIKIEPPSAVGPGSGRVDTVAWKQTMISAGTADWAFLGKRWRPEHCATIEALAMAIDTMWALITPMARVVIRLAGLPSAAAAVLTEVVARAQAEGRPVASLGRALREVGVVACAGTSNITTCGPARGLLGELPERPTEQTAEQLGAPRAIVALTAAVTPPPPLQRKTIPGDTSTTGDTSPRGRLRESLLALLALGEAPSEVRVFGTP